MRTTPDATPGEYVVETELKYRGDGDAYFIEEKDFTIKVISDRAELNIASINTIPTIPEVGEPLTINIRVENFGDGEANSVSGEIDLDFKGTKKAFLGKLDPKEDGPLVFSVIPDKSGEIEYNLKIKYKDDYGDYEILEELSLPVVREGSFWNYLLITAVILAIVGIIIHIYVKGKKESKEINKLLNRTDNGSKFSSQFY
jgi:hypothetical protein